jgi:hypothetical protein
MSAIWDTALDSPELLDLSHGMDRLRAIRILTQEGK